MSEHNYYAVLGLQLPHSAKVKIEYMEGLKFHIVWIDCPHKENLLEAWFGTRKSAEDWARENGWEICEEGKLAKREKENNSIKIHWYRYKCKQIRKGDEVDCDVKSMVTCASCLRRLKNEEPEGAKPLFAKKWQPKKKVFAPYELVEEFGEMNSCSHLDMYDHLASRAKVIEFLNKTWVCFSSTSQYLKYEKVQLIECVPLEEWKGAYNDVDDEDEDADFYKGGRFRSRDNKWWVMTGFEIDVLPLKKEKSLFVKEKI